MSTIVESRWGIYEHSLYCYFYFSVWVSNIIKMGGKSLFRMKSLQSEWRWPTDDDLKPGPLLVPFCPPGALSCRFSLDSLRLEWARRLEPLPPRPGSTRSGAGRPRCLGNEQKGSPCGSDRVLGKQTIRAWCSSSRSLPSPNALLQSVFWAHLFLHNSHALILSSSIQLFTGVCGTCAKSVHWPGECQPHLYLYSQEWLSTLVNGLNLGPALLLIILLCHSFCPALLRYSWRKPVCKFKVHQVLTDAFPSDCAVTSVPRHAGGDDPAPPKTGYVSIHFLISSLKGRFQ